MAKRNADSRSRSTKKATGKASRKHPHKMHARHRKQESKANSEAAAEKAAGGELLDADEVLEMLDVSRPTLYRWMREGRIKGHKAGRQWRFELADIQRFLRGQDPRSELPVDIDPLIDTLTKLVEQAGGEAATPEDASDVRRAVVLMIILGTVMRASDMSIEPQVDDSGENIALIRYRVDGVLRTAAEFNLKLLPAIIEDWKRLAACDVHENKRPQDGRIMIGVPRKKRMDLRVCFVPAMFGESLTVRFLDPEQVVLKLDRMQFQPEDRARIDEALALPSGLIIVTGPTGNGKTTVIYSCLMELVDPSIKVMTIEDPVEYMLPGVVQMPVRPQFDVTFPRALRAMLRSAPDVIFVGEIRNNETMQICMQAALTGHLVFTTLHTDDAPGALRRMVDMGGDPFVIADAVKLIVAQRLVRRLIPDQSSPQQSDEFVDRAEQVARKGGLDWDSLKKDFREPSAAPDRLRDGYRGRMLIAETLKMTPAIGQALREGASTDQLRSVAVSEGMITWPADGVRRAAAGQTTLRELMRFVGT